MPSNARNENFFVSILEFCCPQLEIFSFIAMISFLELLIFIIALCVFGISNDSFLAPNYEGLKILGAADAKSTKNDYEFYRLIMPALLHANMNHISGNAVF